MPAQCPFTMSVIFRAISRLEAEARQDGLPPVCLAVCNAHGELLHFSRMDGAPARVIAIAQGKAYTAARMGTPTAALARRLKDEELTLADFCDPGLTAMRGGLPLCCEAGVQLAVGVSGRRTEDDERLAARLLDILREEAARHTNTKT